MITDKTGDISDRNNKPSNMSTSKADSQDEKSKGPKQGNYDGFSNVQGLIWPYIG